MSASYKIHEKTKEEKTKGDEESGEERRNRKFEKQSKKTKTHLGPPSGPTPNGPALLIVLLTAENKQAPQQMCPQGVRVAFVGGEKQTGQVYDERRVDSSSSGLGVG